MDSGTAQVALITGNFTILSTMIGAFLTFCASVYLNNRAKKRDLAKERLQIYKKMVDAIFQVFLTIYPNYNDFSLDTFKTGMQAYQDITQSESSFYLIASDDVTHCCADLIITLIHFYDVKTQSQYKSLVSEATRKRHIVINTMRKETLENLE